MQKFRSGPVDNRILLCFFVSTPRPHEHRWRERSRSSLFRFYFNHIFFSFVAFVSFAGCRMAVRSTVRSMGSIYFTELICGRWASGGGAVLRMHGTFFFLARSFTNRMAAFARATTFRYSMANILTRSRPHVNTRRRRKTGKKRIGAAAAAAKCAPASDRHCTYRSRGDIRISEFISNEQFQWRKKKQCIQQRAMGTNYQEMESIAYHIRSHIFKSYFALSQQYVATADAKRI